MSTTPSRISHSLLRPHFALSAFNTLNCRRQQQHPQSHISHNFTFFVVQRIRSGAEKLKKARVGKQQGRLDSYFSVLPSAKPSASSQAKRKGDEKSAKGAKKGKSSGGFKPRK